MQVKQRREVVYTGRVQGVGFRYTTCHVATKFDVVGFVKNLPDGRVQLVVEGEPAEIEKFLTGVDQAMAAKILDKEGCLAAATGEFCDFSVSY